MGEVEGTPGLPLLVLLLRTTRAGVTFMKDSLSLEVFALMAELAMSGEPTEVV